MLQEKINGALQALQAIGLPAFRGYPGTKIPVIHNPTVTVSLEHFSEKELTLAADVFVPAERGGDECEETAMRAAEVLATEMAVCFVGNCRYNAPSGQFTVRVLAKFYRQLDYTVKLDNEQIAYAIGFDSRRTVERLPYVDSATGQTLVTVERPQWQITVQDLVPLTQKMTAEKTGTFSIGLMRPGGLETFPGCVWTSIALEETPAGVLRTRVAVTNQERVIGVG